jgi:predicted nucleotidyltransferase
LVEPSARGGQGGDVITVVQIKRYCDAIAQAFRPEKIILFGSHAYGRPNRDSDVDVLVIMQNTKRHGRRPSLAIRRKVPAGFPVDILVKEPRDIAERLREGDSLLEEIVNRGRVMYEAGQP